MIRRPVEDENGMRILGNYRRGVIAMTLLGVALSLTTPGQADDDADFAALQADAQGPAAALEALCQMARPAPERRSPGEPASTWR